MTTTSTARTDRADINRSPTILLASLFAARRSGDLILERLYKTRLADIGIRVVFADPPSGTPSASVAPVSA